MFAAALDLINSYLGLSGQARCPSSIYDLAVQQLVSELWQRHESPNGIAGWGPDGSSVVRMSRDALTAVRPLLAPYRGLGAGG
jgi:hypothetical protein